MNTFQQIASFLLNTIFGIYTVAVLLRFFLQWVKADFYNPVCQMLIKVTNPFLKPLRKVIPGIFGLDLAALFLAIILQVILIALMYWITNIPFQPSFFALAVVISLVRLILHLYFFLIIIRALMSWFTNPYQQNPMAVVLIQLTEPLLRPARRLIKPIGGVDLSPLVVLIAIQVIIIIVSNLVYF